MRASHFVPVLAIIAILAAGCGQKGPLYREAPAPEKTASSEQDTDRSGKPENKAN